MEQLVEAFIHEGYVFMMKFPGTNHKLLCENFSKPFKQRENFSDLTKGRLERGTVKPSLFKKQNNTVTNP